MNIIPINPNPSGAYPPIQNWDYATVPEGYAEITADTTEYFNGFIVPTYENGIIVSFVCNTELWEAWKAAELAKVPTAPELTIEQRATALEATQSDVIDVLASALGVTI